MKLKVEKMSLCELKHSIGLKYSMLDSTAVSIFVDNLVILSHTVFVNSTNTSTNIETAVLSTQCFGALGNVFDIETLKTNEEKRFVLIL